MGAHLIFIVTFKSLLETHLTVWWERRWVISEKGHQKRTAEWNSGLIQKIWKKFIGQTFKKRKSFESLKLILQKQMWEVIGSLIFNVDSCFLSPLFPFLVFNLGNLTPAVLPLINVIHVGLKRDSGTRKEESSPPSWIITNVCIHDCSHWITPHRDIPLSFFIYFTLFTGH